MNLTNASVEDLERLEEKAGTPFKACYRRDGRPDPELVARAAPEALAHIITAISEIMASDEADDDGMSLAREGALLAVRSLNTSLEVSIRAIGDFVSEEGVVGLFTVMKLNEFYLEERKSARDLN